MKVCLIGSTRFMDRYHEANRLLTLAGHLVYTVAMVSTRERDRNVPNISANEKDTLDLVHLMKIEASDAVLLVTDSTGYYGESTKREIKWADMHSRMIYVYQSWWPEGGKPPFYYNGFLKDLIDEGCQHD